MSEKKHKILSDVFVYASSQYVSQFLGFFTSVFLRRFLGPLSMGIWSLLSIVIEYANYAHAGTTSTVFYKLPLLRGQGKTEEAKDLISVVFNFVTWTTLLCSIGVIVYALIFSRTLPKEIFIGLFFVSGLLLTQRVYTFYMTLLRAHKNFGVLGLSALFDAITNLALILLVVSKFKLYGFYFVTLIMPILNVWFIRHYATYDLKLSHNFKGLLSHIRYGFPLLVTGILDRILYSVDKIMIGGFLGLEQLGFYSIALMTKAYGAGVSKNFLIVITPHFLENFSESDFAKSSRHVILYTQVTAYFMAILLSLIFILAPAFVSYALPKFEPGILALKIFLLTTFFLTLAPYAQNFLVGMSKQIKLVPLSVFSIFLNVALNFLFIKIGWGIAGVALASAISSLTAFALCAWYALSHSEPVINIMKFFASALFPLGYCCCVLGIIERFIVPEILVLKLAAQVGAFFLLIIPLILYFDRISGVVTFVFQTIGNRIKRGFRSEEKS